MTKDVPRLYQACTFYIGHYIQSPTDAIIFTNDGDCNILLVYA